MWLVITLLVLTVFKDLDLYLQGVRKEYNTLINLFRKG